MGQDEDTTYGLPTQRPPGLYVRVEPIWFTVSKVKSRMKFVEFLLYKRRYKKMIRRIHDELNKQETPTNRWERMEGQCVCNVKIGKMGLIQDLREYVTKHLSDGLRRKIPHFLENREWNSYYLPIDFPKPFKVPGTGRDVIPVGSSIRLQKEIEGIDQVFRFSEQINADRMAAYLKVSESQVIKADQEQNENPEFWINFAYSLMKKLADESVKNDLPIVFA